MGVIYQASNAIYTGLGTARTLTLLPDGTVFAIGVRAGPLVVLRCYGRASPEVIATLLAWPMASRISGGYRRYCL